MCLTHVQYFCLGVKEMIGGIAIETGVVTEETATGIEIETEIGSQTDKEKITGMFIKLNTFCLTY